MMITNEREIRVALEAMLACALAFYGLWGCAMVLVLLMLPWSPLLAVGAYLVQPIVDWRARKARTHREKNITEFVRDLQELLPGPREPVAPVVRASLADSDSLPGLPAAPDSGHGAATGTASGPSAALEILPAISTHLHSFPQGVFSNMDVTVEAVKIHGDKADALVKFQSPSVPGLVIHRRYALWQLNGHWRVDSRESVNRVDPPVRGCGTSPLLRL